MGVSLRIIGDGNGDGCLLEGGDFAFSNSSEIVGASTGVKLFGEGDSA